jgi:hypothetical protein
MILIDLLTEEGVVGGAYLDVSAEKGGRIFSAGCDPASLANDCQGSIGVRTERRAFLGR